MNAQTVEKIAQADLKTLEAPANTDVRTDSETYRALSVEVQELENISHAVYPFLNRSFGIKELEPNPIDVSNIEPARLLVALYDAARNRKNALGIRELNENEAHSILERRAGRINLLAGKELWVDLNSMAGYVDARWYDFWNGSGKFQEVVDRLKAS